MKTHADGGSTQAPSVALVVPAWDAAQHLRCSLPAMLRAAGDAAVLVVDAGSTDATPEVAAALGARVLRLPQREGPALARNVGAQAVAAEVVLFLDADCAPHPDVVERVRRAFAADPELVSLTGSYDAAPPEGNFFSQYMNLRHHHVHQGARREGATFWAGCGAVRRRAFLEAGGFDAARYPRPQIEDVELGLRLRGRGRMRLDPDLQVTHLKRWTLRSVVETDVRARAIPWTRLVLETGRLPDDLNLRRSRRWAAAVAPFALIGAAGALPAALAGRPLLAAVSLGALLASLVLCLDLVRCFRRRRGPAFALGGWLFHQVHLCYSAATFAAVAAWELSRKSRARPSLSPRGG
jgi:GT2 family glycosyltransferase